jgi:pilus assembly protein Flp/PilA
MLPNVGPARLRKNPCPAIGRPQVRLIAKFLSDETGATAIEYCLIACGIAFAIIATVQAIGPQLSTKFTAVNSSLK